MGFKKTPEIISLKTNMFSVNLNGEDTSGEQLSQIIESR